MLAPSPEVQEQILQLGMSHRPKEVCGLYTTTRVFTLENISSNPENSYEIDAEELVQLLRRLQVSNTDEFGVWHTHPSGHVGPSDGDTRTKIPGFNYFVMAIPSGEGSTF